MKKTIIINLPLKYLQRLGNATAHLVPEIHKLSPYSQFPLAELMYQLCSYKNKEITRLNILPHYLNKFSSLLSFL